MKQESGKKKKWLLPVIIAAVLLIAGGVAAFFLLKNPAPAEQPQQTQTPAQEQQVQSALYWNVDRASMLEAETGLSLREPDENGRYMIRFLKDGQLVELEISDKRLVNAIDQVSAMGLVFDDTGMVVDMVEAKDIAMEVAKEFFVTKYANGILTVNSSIAVNGVSLQLPIGEDAGIYDVSPTAKEPGLTDQVNVLDKVSVFAKQDGTVSHVFIVERSEEADLYLRLEQRYSSKTGSTAREPDANGVYTIEFASKGQIVALKCKDRKIVTDIDKVSAPQNIMGLILDDEGYIERTVTAAQAIRGKLLADNYTVMSIDGNTLQLEKKLYNARDVGKTVTATVSEDCEIYFAEAECEAHFVGQKAEGLQVGDRIFCFTDMDNRAAEIYISRRMQDYDIYYNISQKYDSTKGETTREKENGWYVFQMMGNGKTVTLKTKDKDLANRIDSISSKTMGIKRSGDTIVDVCHMNCVVGNRQPGEGRFVTSFMSNIVSIVSASNFQSGGNYMLGGEAQILDFTGDYGIKPGSQIKELRDGDRLSFWIDVDGNLGAASVTQRYYEGSKLYYNYTRTYSAERGQTKRVPDADGYYVFPMVCEGKEVTVKTKSLELASFIDKDSSRFVALKVSKDGLVKNAYKHVSAIKYGRRTLNSVYYDGKNPDGTIKYYYFSEGKRLEGSSSQTVADNCKIYNYSEIFTSHRGEKTKLQKGDQLQCFAQYDSKEIVQIFVKNREYDSKLYYPVARQYNSSLMETKREPAEDGYYYVELAVDGEIKTFKTKSKTLMSQVDVNSNAFGMKLSGDVIELVFPAASIRGISGSSGGYYDMMGIEGSKMTITRNRPASANTGKTLELVLKKGYKVYDVSPTAETFGAPAQLGLGDRIISYIDDDSKVVTIFIVNKHTRQAGHVSYCEHCDKEVFWEHYVGTVYAADAHYYLPSTNESGYSQKSIGYSAAQLEADETLKQYEVVFDLNGQTYYAKTRLALVYSTLTVMDSVGTGQVVAAGSGRSGGVVMLTSAGGAVLNLYGGTLTNAADTEGHGNGGAIYCNRGTVNMYGGTITGCKGENGGAIYASNGGVVNIYGGKIVGNTATNGGNLWLSTNATLNMQGGEVTNGTAPTGSDIYATATAKMDGDKYAPTLVIKNAQVGEILFENPSARAASVQIADSYVTMLTAADKTTVELSGKVNGGLNMAKGALADLTEMDTASRLTVSADGVFTTEMENVQDYLDCFQPAVSGLTVKQEGSALACTIGEVSFTESLTFSGENAICPVCKMMVAWTPVTQAEFGETGMGTVATNGIHYYLAEDITYTGTETFVTGPGTGKTACFHLNGHDLTATQARVLGGWPGVLNMMGSGTVSGNYQNADHPEYGSTVQINTNKSVGAINLYSGIYTQPAGNTQLTVTGSPVNGGQINVFKDATIEAKSSVYAYYGGRSSAADSRFTVQGATVIGGIYMANRNTEKDFGTYLEIENGKVTGDIIVGKDGNVTLSGAPEIGGIIDLLSGTKLTLKDLAMTTPVAVKANGIFTEPTAQAEAYKTMFKAAEGYDTVSVKENALYTQEKAPATYTDNLTFSGNEAYCPVCQKVVTWTALTQAQHGETGTGTPADGAHYYLAEDITATTTGSFISGPIRSGQVPHVACFHLNGHNLTATQAGAIGGNSGILNVMGSGTVTGNLNMADKTRGAAVNINTTAPQGTVNLYSGTYAKAEGNTHKSIIAAHNNGGSINIYEDVTVLCAVSENAVYVGNSKNNNTHVNIYGGNLGGGIVAADRYGEKETHLGIHGGTIAGNVTVGTISSFTLSGAPAISGVLDLTSGMRITLGDLQETAIRVKANGAFTLANEKAAQYAACFLPTDGYLPVAVRDNVLYLNTIADVDNSPLQFAEGTTEAACPVCGQTVTWTPIAGEEAYVQMKAGHYFLSKDVAVNAADNGKDAYLYMSTRKEETVCLHLNGHDLTVTGHRAIITAPGTLNIMGNGIVSGEKDTASGSTVHVNSTDAGATVNLLGGTYKKSEADTTGSILYVGSNGGSINIYKEAVVDATDRTTAVGGTAVLLSGSEGKPAAVTLCGGVIKNGTTDGKGGNIRLDTAYASFLMQSGTVTGGTSGDNGGNIYVAAGATVEILGGTVQNGTSGKYGGNLFSSGAAPIRIESAVISGGTASSHAGNIFVEGDLHIAGSTVTGGTSGGNGGNVYVGRRSGTTELAKLTVTDSLIGITTLGTDEAFQKGGVANSGGNVYCNYADAAITGSRLLGGETTSHGGNAIINNGKLTLTNTELTGGTTAAQGGAVRVYKSTLTMNGGSISGGSARKYEQYSNANVSLSTDSAFYFLGGTITATPQADRRGTAIDVAGGCRLYLGGNATVVDDSQLAGINTRENSVIRVCSGWTGSANIYLGKLYTAADQIATSLLQVVTLDEDLSEAAGGTFTGSLTQQDGLALTADASGTFKVN